MSTRVIAVRAAAAILFGLAFTGCSIGNGPEFLRDYRRPAPDAQTSDRFWTEASSWQESAKHPDRAAVDLSFWLLPTWLSGRATKLGPKAERVLDTEFEILDLGVIFIPFLPLWARVDTQLERRSGERAENRVTWTPLWTHTRLVDWPADQRRAQAVGLPLLYSRVEYGREGEEPAFELHNVLWTLGPAWMHIDIPDEEPYASGWGFTPLLLAGPGNWLWTSAHIRSDESDITVHGPLNGWLGYRSRLENYDTEFTRRIVAGVLWYDSEESAGDTVVDSRHGPLWGVLGWGRSYGEPVIYLFWFPIEV